MKLPEEIVVAHFVPTVRALLVEALERRGLSQVEIAQRIGVTQSAVSRYAVGKFQADPRLEREPRLRAAVERVAQGLADTTLPPLEALAIFQALVREFENRGPICAIHEEEFPALKGLGCDLCTRGLASSLIEEQAVLADVARAVRTLEETPSLAAFIPHVGTNVAMTLAHAKDVQHVAAVPGGLLELRGRVRAVGPPEFAVSKHVAEIALAAKTAHAQTRAALNLKTDARLLDAARHLGWRVQEVPPEIERAPATLAQHVRAPAPELVYHEGAFGVEPQTYVLAPSASEAARRVRALVERLGE